MSSLSARCRRLFSMFFRLMRSWGDRPRVEAVHPAKPAKRTKPPSTQSPARRIILKTPSIAA